MKPDETREKNEKIIKFLGYELVNDAPKEFPQGYYAQIDGGDWYAIEEFCFHDSWDALMLVVEKILKEKLYSVAYVTLRAKHIGTPIQEVYESVIEFIDWFNEQKKV